MLSQADFQSVHALCKRILGIGAAESDKAMELLLRETGRLIDADDGLWVGMVRMLKGAEARRDPQLGWRGRPVRLKGSPAVRLAVSLRAVRDQANPDPFMTTVALVAQAGEFRSVRLRELVDMKTFQRTSHYKWYYQALGIEDRLCVTFPLNADAESHLIFDRMRPGGRFTNTEVAIVAELARWIPAFHRQQMLAHGLLIATEPLSPIQRRVTGLLLTDASEKTIAEELGQSFHTTHTHVREIFRRFGVSSRAGLMAIWLKGYS